MKTFLLLFLTVAAGAQPLTNATYAVTEAGIKSNSVGVLRMHNGTNYEAFTLQWVTNTTIRVPGITNQWDLSSIPGPVLATNTCDLKFVLLPPNFMPPGYSSPNHPSPLPIR